MKKRSLVFVLLVCGVAAIFAQASAADDGKRYLVYELVQRNANATARQTRGDDLHGGAHYDFPGTAGDCAAAGGKRLGGSQCLSSNGRARVEHGQGLADGPSFAE
jgi:hypothetical protein